MKTRASRPVASSSSSSEEDISLGDSQEEAPTPLVPSTDASSSASTRHNGRTIFQCKFTNIEAARVISSAFKSSMEIPLFQWSQISKHPEWMPQINAWFSRFQNRFCWNEEHNTVMRRVWENHAATRDFKPIYIPEDIWLHYLQHVMSERFTRHSQSGAGNRNRPIHGSVTMHTGGSVPFVTHAKQMATSLGREPSPMELFVGTHVRSQDRQKRETYNNRLRETYGDDPSTHPEFDPDLWMEAGSLGGSDKNRVYGLSNTTADNLRTTRTASTVRSSQSVSSFQSKEFVALQQKCDHLSEAYTQLKEQYRADSKQQRAAYEELRQIGSNEKLGVVTDCLSFAHEAACRNAEDLPAAFRQRFPCQNGVPGGFLDTCQAHCKGFRIHKSPDGMTAGYPML
ncbi:hypothetical protein NC653_008133 [Populus alba x Populus x berolinensis]|uniref:Transposase n=1 Tax=Populus alba x Populus x berolinensis TaxID=444605 RepID=A0AAD6R5P2_9ROSI|nr:hypothetical protein NC653_008133 [Populus alba x Populus x berolinensis]